MRKIIFILFFGLIYNKSISQEKQKVIFIIDENNKKEILFENHIFKLNNLTFRYYPKKNIKKLVNIDSIKEYIIDVEDFEKILKENSDKVPKIYSKYDFYIYISKKSKIGCLYPVERIWLVEKKTIN